MIDETGVEEVGLEDQLLEITSCLKNKWIFSGLEFPQDRTAYFNGTNKEFAEMINSLSEPLIYVNKYLAMVEGSTDEETDKETDEDIDEVEDFEEVWYVDGLPQAYNNKIYHFNICFIHNGIYHVLERYSTWSDIVLDFIDEVEEMVEGKPDSTAINDSINRLENNREEIIKGFFRYVERSNEPLVSSNLFNCPMPVSFRRTRRCRRVINRRWSGRDGEF